MHGADWLQDRLTAERVRLSEGAGLPQPWAECAIITRDMVRDLDTVALETWIEKLTPYERGYGDVISALDNLKREFRHRQDEERLKALAIAQESLDATKRTYWPSIIAAWASVIAAVAAIVGLGVALFKP